MRGGEAEWLAVSGLGRVGNVEWQKVLLLGQCLTDGPSVCPGRRTRRRSGGVDRQRQRRSSRESESQIHYVLCPAGDPWVGEAARGRKQEVARSIYVGWDEGQPERLEPRMSQGGCLLGGCQMQREDDPSMGQNMRRRCTGWHEAVVHGERAMPGTGTAPGWRMAWSMKRWQ